MRGELPAMLNAGTYKFNVIFGENQRYALFSVEEIVQFDILNESLGSNNESLPGVIRPDISYSVSLNS